MLVGITGGTGFIAKSLVRRHLDAGDTVRLLTRKDDLGVSVDKGVKIFHADLTGPVDLLGGFTDCLDVLYHCAGEVRDQSKMYQLHVEGTGNLIRAARRKIGHWVQLSSVGAYGKKNNGSITESSELKPEGVYEETKTVSDSLVQEAGEKGFFTYTILRPSIVFGPAMSNQSVFQLISMVKRKRFFYIGEPGAMANYIYVDNVVDGLILCGTRPEAQGRVYNLSNQCTLEEFVSIIARELGIMEPNMRFPKTIVFFLSWLLNIIPNVPLTTSRVRALTNRAVYSIARIRAELGYEHNVSMEEGLIQMIRAWQDKYE